MSDFDSDYERNEEAEAARKALEAWTQAMETHPDLVQHMMQVQQAAMRGAGGVHVCGLCQRKRRFVRLVELMTLVNVLKPGQDNAALLYAIEWAWRVPAVRLVPFSDLIPPALDLVRWCAQPDTAPQPAWYDKGPMDNEGGHV